MLDVGLSMHMLELEITTKCNLNCLHCYNRENKNLDMDVDEIIKYINFANKNNVHTFTISGGEAALHPEFKKICEYLKNNRNKLDGIKKVTLQTNGYIKNIDLKKLKGFDYIHLSFDIDENGARIINSKNTITLAKDLQKLEIKPYLFTTVHKKNVKHIDEIVKIANDNNVPIAFNFCIDTGKDKDFLLSEEEKVYAIQKLLNYEKQGKINKLKHPYVNSYKKMSLADDEKFKIKGGCTAGIASCSILANGDVIPCPFVRVKAGNIHEEQLEKIWLESDLFRQIRDRKSYEVCGDCKYLAYCGGCRRSALQSSNKINGYDYNCIRKVCVSESKAFDAHMCISLREYAQPKET